jgi:single-stranded-DNA-specific exonuclease
MNIITRDVPPRAAWALEQAGVQPLLARLFASRGIEKADELDPTLSKLLPPDGLRDIDKAATLLADAIQNNERICIVADYDCDGATACAVSLRGLALLGAQPENLGYVVPDRAIHGYGLTPAIVDLALPQQPQLLMTVDNGIASLAGVAHAKAMGLKVLVTDHHLAAAEGLPDADALVNPNQPACTFESKSLAGVGVAFYVLLALRSELRKRGAFDAQNQPRLDVLLDLVALGTVADVVKLDANNRRLVAQGLKRMRAGRMQPGLTALFAAAGRDPSVVSATDLGFTLGPRINAAGRLSDMTLGIECLMTEDFARASELAKLLDEINRERRDIEAGMREQAEGQLDRLMPGGEVPAALSIYEEEFHEGVVGIVASRLKDRLHRPCFVFARGQDGSLKGSGRSIAGFHLRDALDLVAKRHPDVMKKFGGHAMAAGCTLTGEAAFATFDAALQQVAREWLEPEQLTQTLRTDGPLPADAFNVNTVQLLDAEVWGQAFEAPVFFDAFEVLSQRIVGEKHLKLRLRQGSQQRDAIWFQRTEALPEQARLAYRLDLNTWNGQTSVQLIVVAQG